MHFDLIWKHADLFVDGIGITLSLTFISLIIGFVIAVPASVLLAGRRGLMKRIIGIYVYIFRGTPMLVQLYLVYYGLAQFEWVRDSVFWVILRDPFYCALITFSLNTGAYTTEILRGAQVTMPKGEIEAAKAFGFSRFQALKRIILPSAFRRALPQYGNEVIFMLHGSAIVSVITLQDILGAARHLNSKYYIAYEGLLTAAALYLIITLFFVGMFSYMSRTMLAHLSGASAPTRI